MSQDTPPPDGPIYLSDLTRLPEWIAVGQERAERIR
jgi:hypothetical protein